MRRPGPARAGADHQAGAEPDRRLLPPATPNTSDPGLRGQGGGVKDYSAAGVDTGSIAIRGGTHYEFSFIPDPAFPAALRGADLTTWYTTAWFDAYLKGDPTAFRRLRTDRWRHDAASAAVDPDADANMMSRYYRSRLDIGRGGERFVCEDLRAGCAGLAADDGEPRDYDYLSIVTRPDAGTSGSAGRRLVRRHGGGAGRIGAHPGAPAAGERAGRREGRGASRHRAHPAAGEAPAARRRLHGAVPRRHGAVKHVTVVRRHGRWSKRRPFRSLSSCGAIRFASLGRAAFGGRLRVYYRLNVPARVTVTVRRGNRVVRRIAARDRAAGPTFRVRAPARRGEYRVTVEANPAGAQARRVTVAARRL